MAPARLASAVVLTRTGPDGLEVFWVRRGDQLHFAGGFHAFPGGRVDDADALIPVQFAPAPLQRTLIASAARELFEETGVLAADGAARIPLAERDALRTRLIERPPRPSAPPSPFADFLARHGLFIDARRFLPAGRWVTPLGLPLRYDARFFLLALPPHETCAVWPGELADGAWVTPAFALAQWDEGRALLHPPAWHTLKVLAQPGLQADLRLALPWLTEPTRAPWALPLRDFEVRRIEFQRGVLLVPLRTPTLPPATHTNCILLGDEALWVVDPGSPWESQQRRLDEALDALAADGRRAQGIVLTHFHHDHVAGAMALSARLSLPILAHAETAARLQGEVRVDRLLSDGEPLEAGSRTWRLLHLPGHSRGHLCLFDERSRAVIAGDLVAGAGTVVIDPPDGDLRDYLASLDRLLALSPGTLYPAHGPVVPGGARLLAGYVQHRLEREALVLAALDAAPGPATPEELVPHAYAEADPSVYPLAARSLLAHLLKLEQDGRAARTPDGRFRLV